MANKQKNNATPSYKCIHDGSKIVEDWLRFARLLGFIEPIKTMGGIYDNQSLAYFFMGDVESILRIVKLWCEFHLKSFSISLEIEFKDGEYAQLFAINKHGEIHNDSYVSFIRDIPEAIREAVTKASEAL
ncbi:MAG: hypothetical protein WCL30_01060 [Pseudomonadota bacterium]